MHLIDHPTATPTNQFTDGDPVNSIPSTYVIAKWLNAVQGELQAIVEEAGIALDDTDNAQAVGAIRLLRDNETSVFSLSNNVTDQAVTGLAFDPTITKSFILEWDLYRKDSTKETIATGKISYHWKAVAGSWVKLIDELSSDGEHGVTFGSTVGVGDVLQVVYSTSNFAGANHDAKLRYKIKRFSI